MLARIMALPLEHDPAESLPPPHLSRRLDYFYVRYALALMCLLTGLAVAAYTGKALWLGWLSVISLILAYEFLLYIVAVSFFIPIAIWIVEAIKICPINVPILIVFYWFVLRVKLKKKKRADAA